MKFAKWNPFRLRNLALGALALGILVGIWLGDVFKGFGGGSSWGVGLENASPPESSNRTDLVNFTTTDESESKRSSGLVRILIDDRDYFVRLPKEDRPIDLPTLVKLVKSREPNADGLRAVIDRTASSRPSAEQRLKDALKEAGIPEKSVYLKPTAVD
ncbi:MAG: hypothetical protein U0872_09650 [Planctomycetaceae bacterium]